MQSTYDQLIHRFKTQLHEVAEFEGEESQTLEVIIDCLKSSGFREICDGYDALLKNSTSTVADTAEKKNRKAAPSKKSKEDDEDKDKEKDKEKEKEKPRRVTAYNVFVAEQVKVKKTTMKDAAALWKNMNDEQKQPYAQKAKEANAA